MNLITEPIDHWPYPDTATRKSPLFKAKYADTLKLLERELDFIGVTAPAVLQVVTADANAVRRDGALRARAKIAHPGVRLSFESRYGPLTYATDQYESDWYGSMISWQANLRAVALGLEALRAVDRYGITRSGEQYTGWLAIEGRKPMTYEQALQTLRTAAGPSGEGVDGARLVRAARAATHPDRNGGDQSLWDEVERAVLVLEASS